MQSLDFRDDLLYRTLVDRVPERCGISAEAAAVTAAAYRFNRVDCDIAFFIQQFAARKRSVRDREVAVLGV